MDLPKLVLIDGAGERYIPVDVKMGFMLKSEKTGNLVTVDQSTYRELGVEMEGKLLHGPRGGVREHETNLGGNDG